VCLVTVAMDAGTLRLSIADDGIGIPALADRGMGMRSMAERAAEVGGEWSVTPAPSGGTLVTATLPVVMMSLPETKAFSGVRT
jgi:two-component system NarL family sensor kinase